MKYRGHHRHGSPNQPVVMGIKRQTAGIWKVYCVACGVGERKVGVVARRRAREAFIEHWQSHQSMHQ